MKKIVLPILIVLVLTSCGDGSNTKAGWSEDNKETFLKECVSGSQKSANLSEAQAKEYCNCMMGKLEEKYPDALDVSKATEAEMDAFAKDCNK